MLLSNIMLKLSKKNLDIKTFFQQPAFFLSLSFVKFFTPKTNYMFLIQCIPVEAYFV